MKKAIAIVLAVMMVFSLTACGGSVDTSQLDEILSTLRSIQSTLDSMDTAPAAVAPAEAPTDEPAEEADEAAADLGELPEPAPMSDPADVEAETGTAPGGTEYTVKTGLYYVDDALPQQTLDVYLPAGEMPEGGWPVMVSLPGGGYFVCPADLTFEGTSYGNEYKLGALDNGIAVISVSYRTPTDYTETYVNGGITADMYKDRTELAMLMADDVMAALRYITENAEALGINPDEILLLGESAGGGLADYVVYGVEELDGYSIRAVAGLAPANHDVWTDKDWSRTGEYADESDPPFYIATGTHDTVCDPVERGLGFANLLLSKGVNVTFEIMPDAVHMAANVDNNFYARAIELDRQNAVWDWFKTVLADELPEAPASYALTYNTEASPEIDEKAMVDMEPLVENED